MRIAVVEHQTVRPFELVRQIALAGHEAVFVTCDLALYLRGREPQDTDLRHASRTVQGERTADPDALYELVKPLQADLVLTVSEQHTQAVAEVSARLGLAHTSLPAVHLTRDKYSCRRHLAATGVPQPAFRIARDVAGVLAAAEQIGYPVVIKPVDGSASVNVGVAHDPEQAAACTEPILAQTGYGRSTHSARTVLVEEFMPGDLVSCETLSSGGKHLVLGLTDRQLTPLPHQVELGGCFPVDPPGREEIVASCLQALDAIGFDLGAAHTEIMLTPAGPRVVEINGRLTGGPMPFVIDAALGRSVHTDFVGLFAGGRLPAIEPTGRVAGIRSMVVDRAGRLTRVEPSPLRDAPGVVDYEIRKTPGDLVRPPRNNRDRCGSVVTVAAGAEEARALAASVAATTAFEIEPVLEPA
jgi:S-sulfo-L-cysteine synthase (3-phospho-L-serine-dependent)